MLYKLPTEFKTKWLEALRSGRYTQAQERLKCSSGFCCLGVAIDIVNPQTWDEDADEDYFWTANQSELMPQHGDLPDDVLNVLNQTILFKGRNHTVAYYVAQLNDNGKSFSEIAQWIEENL